jgi:acyl-CoA thioesterase FadM
MNLWLRLLWLVATARFRGRLDPPLAVSELPFRVMPHDLDTSLHMNNGRYWTLMDLGRTDLMLRMGLWRAVLKHGWTPIVSAGKIRFRRELRLWRALTLKSRILCWSDTWAVIEHRIVSRRDGRGLRADPAHDGRDGDHGGEPAADRRGDGLHRGRGGDEAGGMNGTCGAASAGNRPDARGSSMIS